MGQFQSKEYDGDPYVDLMRALPERELIWWVQKAIWVSAAAAGCCGQLVKNMLPSAVSAM